MTDIMQTISRHFSQTMHFSPEATDHIMVKIRATLSRDIEVLERTLREGDRAPVSAKLHKLKGDLSNIGLQYMADAVHTLQKDEAIHSLEDLRQRVRALRQELSPLLDS
jgi:HPt (histidine-containing phosphotransfer) domain-containing protein